MTFVLSYFDFYYYHSLTYINLGFTNRCRWVPNSEEHLIYVKYDGSSLNILDAQKGILTLKNPVLLEKTKDGILLNFCSFAIFSAKLSHFKFNF